MLSPNIKLHYIHENIFNHLGASPSTGRQTAENNSSRSNEAQKETFDMDLSPFYDIIEELQANLSSLRVEAVRICDCCTY